MAKPKAPTNFYINRYPTFNVLVWNSVVKDLDQNYTRILAYNIYRTQNPAGKDWVPLKTWTLADPNNYNDPHIEWIDFSPGEFLYRVCAVNAEGEGDCAISYGIIGEGGLPIIPTPCLWDVGLFDQCLWG